MFQIKKTQISQWTHVIFFKKCKRCDVWLGFKGTSKALAHANFCPLIVEMDAKDLATVF